MSSRRLSPETPLSKRAGLLALLCALTALGAMWSPAAHAAATHRFLSKITEVPATGPKGESVPVPGPIEDPIDLTVDSGSLWFAEYEQKHFTWRVNQFEASSGAFLSQLPRQDSEFEVMEDGVAVGHATGETEVYVGGDSKGSGAVAVFTPAGARQSIINGSGTPQKTFGGFNGGQGYAGVAIDENPSNLSDWAAGDLYVAAEKENVIDVFTPEAHGGAKYVTQLTGPCTTPAACPAGERFSEPSALAVDRTNGEVMVVNAFAEVDVFKPVEPMAGLHEYQLVRRITGPPSGSFKSEKRQLHGVAVGGGHENGDIYVVGTILTGSGANNVVVQFNVEGKYMGRITGVSPSEPFDNGKTGILSGLAIDPASGELYVGEEEAVDVFGANLVIPDVETGPVTEATPYTATLNGDVNALEAEAGEGASCRFVWGTSREDLENTAKCPSAVGGSSPTAVAAAISGLRPDTTYYYLLQAENKNGVNANEPGDIREFTTPGPSVVNETVLNVREDSAGLRATVVPHNGPSSLSSGASEQWFFQYSDSSTESCPPEPSGGSCLSAPAEQPSLPAETESTVEVSAGASGLTPDITYHYRLVILSEMGGKQEAFTGPDQTFTTRPVGEFTLPDHRQWQLVSPPDKHGALIEPIGEDWVIQAAANGRAITYATDYPTEGNPEGYVVWEQVLSTLGPEGWKSLDIEPPHNASHTGLTIGQGQEYRFFSEDLSRAIVHPFGPFDQVFGEQTLPPATEQTPMLHTDFVSGEPADMCQGSSCYRPLVTGAPGFADVPEGTVFGSYAGAGHCEAGNFCGPIFEGGTPDLSHVLLSSARPLTEGAPDHALYVWSAGKPPAEALQLVSVLPANGAGEALPTAGESAGPRHVISNDGSRVLWTSKYELYLRENATQPQSPTGAKGECTVPADACTVQIGSELPGLLTYQTASTDLSRVFFTEAGDLYEYDAETASTTALTSGAEIQNQVIGASEDGSYVYFAAKGVLGDAAERGAGPGSCALGSASATCNLYVDHDGTIELIAVLSGADAFDWGQYGAAIKGNLTRLTARVSPNGEWLAFMSQRGLTGYDNRDVVSGQRDDEVFEYSAATGKVVCASCNPTNGRPHGFEEESLETDQGGLVGGDGTYPSEVWLAASVPGWTPDSLGGSRYQSRYLSNSGRLFFNAGDSLVPKDVNGTQDVYEFEPAGVGTCSESTSSGSSVFSARAGGCVSLISAGTSSRESAFLDASETGGDVFFLTASQLAAQDTDNALDAYDAHECTNAAPCLPEPAVQPPPCTSEASCRPAPTPQPAIFGLPPSATFSGAGNVAAPTAGAGVTPRKASGLAQTLKRALRTCRRERSKRRRSVCEKRAKKRYGVKAKTTARVTSTVGHGRGR